MNIVAWELRCRVTGAGESKIVRTKAGAVIDNDDTAEVLADDIDFNGRCSSIKGVFEKFANDRRWTVNDFTGGDQCRNFGRKNPDRH
jgi:hypothetical protein